MKKKLFIFITAICSALMLNAAQYGGDFGVNNNNLHWSLDTEVGELIITGQGQMNNYNQSAYGWYQYREYIKTISLPEGMVNIGKNCFYDCTNLESVTIPSSITTIGNYAFNGCKKLTSIDIPNTVQTIGDGVCNSCSGLLTAHVGNGVSIIPMSAFWGCSSLDSIHLGSAIDSIGAAVFINCSSLRAMRLDAVVPPKIQSSYAFQGVPIATAYLYVPQSGLAAYTATNSEWRGIFYGTNHIVAMDVLTVTFKGWKNGQENVVLQSGNVFMGDDAVAPEVPARPGYRFTGWDVDFTNVQENLVVNALYEEILYTVQFVDYNDAPLGAAQQIREGGTAIAPTEPARVGYSFAGWDKDFSAVTENMTVKAIYEAEKRLGGVFSVSATKTVQFAPGNLQYNAATDQWRFAAHQYDVIGEANENVSATYDGWIDLLSRGSGYDNKMPYETSNDLSKYCSEDNIQATENDWAYHNAITNGGNAVHQWFTLSAEEWDYLLSYRPNATAKVFTATVCGVKGYVLVPDNWAYGKKTPSNAELAWNTAYQDIFDATSWAEMENAGAIFLPATSYRDRQYYMDGVTEDEGWYWTASNTYRALRGSSIIQTSSANIDYGMAVRPARQVQTQFTVRFVDEDGTTVLQEGLWDQGTTPIYSGSTPTKAEDDDHTYKFKGWDKEVAAVMGDVTYTATYETIFKVTITFENWDHTILQQSKWAYDSIPVYSGETPTRESTAQFDYVFDGWSGMAIGPAVVNTTYTAHFEAVTRSYMITVVADHAASVVARTDNETLLDLTKPQLWGTPIYLTITPEEGYELIGWSENYDSFYGHIVVGEATIVATLELKKYTVTIVSEHGTVTATDDDNNPIDLSQPIQHGTHIWLTATPEEHWLFEQWENYNAATGLTVTGEITITAEYAKDPTDIDNILSGENATKVLRDGQILILRGDKTYSITGQEVR